MAKGKASSASSATRKKHARKAAAVGGELEPPVPKEKKPKGKEKGKKGKELKKKVYIPPVKPAPVQPDPLDTLGIAQRISPELHVVLRRLAKKDSITKQRALEELQADWVDKSRTERARVDELVEVVPVWFHHVPALFLHPSRRIRILAVGLHSSLLNLPPPVSDQLIFFLREVATADQAELILGAWCMSAYDVDRQLSSYARQSWEKFVSISRVTISDSSATSPEPVKKTRILLDSTGYVNIWGFIQRVLLDPGAIYLSINPPQPVAPLPLSTQRKSGVRTPQLKKDDDSGTRSRDEEENELDRNARLRISAFGAAEWALNSLGAAIQDPEKVKEFIAPLDNVALWTALYHNRAAPFVPPEIQAFGWSQPVVRKSAWSLLQTLLVTCKVHLNLLLSSLSSAILRSAWVEPDPNVRGVMWKPLLTFLKEFPSSWELEAVLPEPDDEDEDSEDEAAATKEAKADPPTLSVSIPYKEFLQFLELGCNGSPLHGYPAVLVILSTIPPSILATAQPPLQTLTTSFWAAIDGRALSGLDKAEASLAFLAALLESVVFLARRIRNDPNASVLSEDPPAQASQAFVGGQITMLLEEMAGERLKVDATRAGEEIVRTIVALHKTDLSLFDAAWEALLVVFRQQLNASDKPISAFIPVFLQVFDDRFEQGSHPSACAQQLITEVLQATVSRVGGALEKDEKLDSENSGPLLTILNQFGSKLFQDSDLTQIIDETIVKHVSRVLSASPALLLLYFLHRKDEGICLTVWHQILRTLAGDAEAAKTVVPPLLVALENGTIPSYLRPQGDEFDKVVSILLAEALTKHQAEDTLGVVRKIMERPQYFIPDESYRGLVVSIAETFSAHTEIALRENPTLPLETFSAPLSLLRTVLDSGLDQFSDGLLASLFPNIFYFAYLVSRYRAMSSSQKQLAESIWRLWLSKANEDDKKIVSGVIKANIRDMLSDCFALPRPSHIVQLFTSSIPGFGVEAIEDVFPVRGQLDAILDTLPSSPSDPSLAVLDSLTFPGDFDDEYSQTVVDATGYSSYARIVNAMLLYLMEDRPLAKENAWALRHFLALAQYADEVLLIPTTQSVVFGPEAAVNELQEIISRVQQVVTYLLSSSAEEGWLTNLAGALLSGKRSPTYDGVAHLLHDIVLCQSGRDNIRESRILHTLLKYILSDASKQDADQFILIARRVETKAPHIALAILQSISSYCPEPPRMDRYRNELAAGAFGIPASKANYEGLWTLRKLAAIAPDPESDVIFLPTPRVVNLLKQCQQWVASDEDIDEEVELEMTGLFTHLAPILQSVPGSHWDFMFDIMENNLEGSSLDDASTLPALSRTLRLFVAIQNLASTNRALRSTWQERERTQLSLIKDLVSRKSATSGPLAHCRELAISIIQDLPEALIDKETLQKMCHLVTDNSQSVQKMAYHMLRDAAAKHTEYTVVEAAVDTEGFIKPELPSELIDILQRTIEQADETEDTQNHNAFSDLLIWMLIFDLFTNASLKVKSSYIDHLQRLNLISDHFLPLVFNILGLYGGVAKAFKLDIWAVDEFYLDYYVSDTPHSLKLLAAHLYFRALLTVPSLFSTWLRECREKQLSTTVTAYTSNYFSPAIIRAELAQVKDPVKAADLADDSMKVKVANTVNEVTALYVVDEYQLELKISLPSDWPLHNIEIQDKRVGVSKERWRAWILGVQQILTSRSGSIVDGLTFFKKNVASYFEGQIECAICYSVICATDNSLPAKPCKTCKNRFHAACLYKWFSTSHSSSCPLCRSEIMN